MDLRPEELRVLGCLIEKELSTPAYYPLTLNALVNACNQTSNRDPVVNYDERTVEAALTSLRERALTRIVYSPSNRAAKYRHVLDEAWGLQPPELAVLAVLLLRGPQTTAELRTRTERMHAFESAADIDAVLDWLASRHDPLAVRLARQPGQREARTAHLLAGRVDTGASAAPVAVAPTVSGEPAAWARTETGTGPAETGGDAGRLAALEAAVAQLRDELEDLRARLDQPPPSG